jgi:Xaa-Pro aminopeptidase
MTTNDKIAKLRQKMIEHKIDAYIIPSADPHQSEYVADCWKDREWISGFNGSSGLVVITQKFSGLWTDSRYYLQGEQQTLGSEITLMKIINQFEPEHLGWIKENVGMGMTVGVDGNDISYTQYLQMEKYFQPLHINIETKYDLISEIWNDRPDMPQNPIFMHADLYVAQTASEKIHMIKEHLKAQDASHIVFTSLDDIAWLLNMRGSDVKYNPLFISYVIIGEDEDTLFIDESKVSDDIRLHLINIGLKIKPYQDITRYLNRMDDASNVLIEFNSVNYNIYRAINGNKKNNDSIVRITKGIKSEKEVDYYRQAMVDDGVALAKSFHWLMKTVQDQVTDEYIIGEKIAEYRAITQDYKGESFSAIVGYEGNGAIIHYKAEKETAAKVKNEGVLLVDCGGQYERGTTDITRTFAMGAVSESVKKHYTLVLKGHVALSMVKFPENTTCAALDVLARQFLWEEGLNYLHGTGHGIGYFLNVHEGPHGFASATTERGRVALKPGMIITNEPGLYITHHYGIRIENVLVVKKSTNDQFLEFETITLYPYDFNMIDERMLTVKEKAWINSYHKNVYDKVSPHLDDATKEWFWYRCKMFG